MSDNTLRILTEPWAIRPEMLRQIADIYVAHALGEHDPIAAAEAAAQARESVYGGRADKPYQVLDGVAVVPMVGVMGRRMNLFRAISGGVSTQIVASHVADAAADPSIRAIVLEVDSPGGTVDGTQDLARTVRQADAQKPVFAVATGMMCSAAYWVGSAARQVVATEDSMPIGSIGVIATHVDLSRARDKAGMAVTEITAGRYKALASDAKPLSDEGRAYMQETVDALYAQFLAAVAEHRGTDPQSVHERMADGRVWLAVEAEDRGLIDRIAAIEEVIHDARAHSMRTHRVGFGPAATNDTKPKRALMDLATIESDHPELAAQLREQGAAAARTQAETDRAAAVAQAVAAERERITAIDEMAVPGAEAIVAACKADGTSPGDAARKILAHQRQSMRDTAAALDAAAPAAVPQAPAEEGAGANAGKPQVNPHDLAAKARAYQAEQAKAGRTVSAAEAVRAVQAAA